MCLADKADIHAILLLHKTHLDSDANGLEVGEMLLPSFISAMKRLIQRLTDRKDYEMFENCLNSIRYWKINDHLAEYKKNIGVDNVKVVKIERNLYRFIGNVSLVCLEIALELNTVSDVDVNVSIRTKHKNLVWTYPCTFLDVLSYVNIDDELKPEVPTEETAELKNSALAKPLQEFFSAFCALETVVPWASFDGNELQLRCKANVCYLYLILVKRIEFESFPKCYTYKYLFLAVAPSICKMLSQPLNETQFWKLVRLMSHFTDLKVHLSLDISDINQSKGNKLVEMLKNLYKKTTLFSAIGGSSKLIDDFLDMFSWQARFTLIEELLVNTEASDGFATLIIWYFRDKLLQFFLKGEADEIVLDLIKKTVKRLFQTPSDKAHNCPTHVEAILKLLQLIIKMKDVNNLRLNFDKIFFKPYKKVYGEFIEKWQGILKGKEKDKETMVYLVNLDPLSLMSEQIPTEFEKLPLKNVVPAIKEKLEKMEPVEKLLFSLSSSLSKA